LYSNLYRYLPQASTRVADKRARAITMIFYCNELFTLRRAEFHTMGFVRQLG